MEMCHCGLPLHYTDPKNEVAMRDLIALIGPYVLVTQLTTGRVFKVQRHFIALHGVRGDSLHTYGFEEVGDGPVPVSQELP